MSHVQQMRHCLSADHAFEWAVSRAAPGWDASVQESATRAMESIISWSTHARKPLPGSLQACITRTKPLLMKELSDAWSVAIAELESSGDVSRGLMGTISQPTQLAAAEALIAEGRKHATADAASLLVCLTTVTIPELARAHDGYRAMSARLLAQASDADREAGKLERRAASEAALRGLDLAECRRIADSTCVVSDLVPEPTPGALEAAAAVASEASAAARRFACARACEMQTKLPTGYPILVKTPVIDSLIVLGTQELAVRLSEGHACLAEVVSELRIVVSLLLAAEQDSIAIRKDLEASEEDGGGAINTLASFSSREWSAMVARNVSNIADGSLTSARRGSVIPLCTLAAVVSSATVETVAGHRAVVAQLLVTLTDTPMRVAVQRASVLSDASPDIAIDPRAAVWTGNAAEWQSQASTLREQAARLFADAKRLDAKAADVEMALGDAILRARAAKTAVECLIGAAIERPVVVAGCEDVLAL